uniref:CD34 molecule n=1 Tax=Loxodonta africana TaxID=9785 RepID=G3T814_LOXAF
MQAGEGGKCGTWLHRDGWNPKFLFAVISSGFTDASNMTTVTAALSSTENSSFVPKNATGQEAIVPSTLGSTSPSNCSQNSSGTSEAHLSSSVSTVNYTSTSGITSIPGTMNTSVQSQTTLTFAVSTTPTNFLTSKNTLEPSMFSGNVSDGPSNSTSPMTSHTKSYTSSPPSRVIVKREINCVEIKQVRLTQGICLEQNETSRCEDFKKDKGEDLVQILCDEKEQAGAEVCSLLLAQSEIKPQCLMLFLPNRTELPSKLQFMEKHRFDLQKLGIRDFTEENVLSHQSHSRKTLIAVVTSGILLAILGTTGYFLMNRRSWNPAGERLGEEPYHSESGGGQGYSSSPGASPEAQGKAIVNQGAQENGTGQATSRNGHSARQHVVADTEL